MYISDSPSKITPNPLLPCINSLPTINSSCLSGSPITSNEPVLHIITANSQWTWVHAWWCIFYIPQVETDVKQTLRTCHYNTIERSYPALKFFHASPSHSTQQHPAATEFSSVAIAFISLDSHLVGVRWLIASDWPLLLGIPPCCFISI